MAFIQSTTILKGECVVLEGFHPSKEEERK
jgi:hypothetical protein